MGPRNAALKPLSIDCMGVSCLWSPSCLPHRNLHGGGGGSRGVSRQDSSRGSDSTAGLVSENRQEMSGPVEPVGRRGAKEWVCQGNYTPSLIWTGCVWQRLTQNLFSQLVKRKSCRSTLSGPEQCSSHTGAQWVRPAPSGKRASMKQLSCVGVTHITWILSLQ